MRHGLLPLGDLLGNSLKALDLEKRLAEHSCILAWDEVVGERVANAARPDSIRDGRLFVTTKSPTWANELLFLKADIIEKLNQRAGREIVKEIIFRAGRVSPRPGVSSPPTREVEVIELTSAELKRIDKIVKSSGLESPESVRSLLIRAMKFDKWKKAHGWTPCKVCGALQDCESGVCPPCERGWEQKDKG